MLHQINVDVLVLRCCAHRTALHRTALRCAAPLEHCCDDSFPADETMAKANFPDPASTDASMNRLDEVASAAASLAHLFALAGKDAAKTAEVQAESMDTLPPELMKMLEQAMVRACATYIDSQLTQPFLSNLSSPKTCSVKDERGGLSSPFIKIRGIYIYIYIFIYARMLQEYILFGGGERARARA